MGRRVVGPDQRLRTPQAAQHVVQAQRLLAGEMRLVQRPRLRGLPGSGERTRLGQSGDRRGQTRRGITPKLVRAHRRSRSTVDEPSLVRGQIELVQPLILDVGVQVLVLPVVDDEVLHLGHRTDTLHTVDLRPDQLVTQKRILAGRRQVPAPVRQTVKIGLRPEHARDHERATLTAFGLAPGVAESTIERRTKRHQRRRTGRAASVVARRVQNALRVRPTDLLNARRRPRRRAHRPDVVTGRTRPVMQECVGVRKLTASGWIARLELRDQAQNRRRVRSRRVDRRRMRRRRQRRRQVIGDVARHRG